MIMILIRAVNWFAELLIMALFIEAMMSWFVRDLNSPLGRVYNGLRGFTEPVVRPVRNFMSRFNTGMFDFSIFVAMILIEIVARLITRILLMLI